MLIVHTEIVSKAYVFSINAFSTINILNKFSTTFLFSVKLNKFHVICHVPGLQLLFKSNSL